MNPLKWAKTTLKPFVTEDKRTTAEAAAVLRDNAPPQFFEQESTRWWVFQTLARDVNRALGIGSVRPVEIEEDGIEKASNTGYRSSPGTYTPEKLLSIDDYRDQLLRCVEDVEKFQAKGRRVLKAAIAAGHRSLRDEFPMFDTDAS